MTIIVTRSGKGSPLSYTEMDANFTNLNTNKLEATDLVAYETTAHATATYETKTDATISHTTLDNDKLNKSSNLSDVSSASASRTNLGLGTAAVLDVGTTANKVVQLDGSAKLPAVDGSQLTNLGSAMPAGALMPFAIATAPVGWLECDGAEVSRTTYATLFAAISTMYGAGNGTTTFNLPDLRGQFLRGWAHGSTIDPDKATRTNRGDGTTGDNVGTKQADGLKSHTHSGTVGIGVNGSVSTVGGGSIIGVQSDGINFSIGNTGGNETRPTNVNVLYCIKT